MDYKMYQQLLKEAGDTPPPPLTKKEFKKEYKEGINVAYEFQIPSGTYIVRFDHFFTDEAYMPSKFASLLTMDDFGAIHSANLTFGPKNHKNQYDPQDILHYQMTGEGYAFLIMAGVIAAVEDFIKSYHDYTFIEFSASGRGRVKAYNFLTHTLARKHNLDFYIDNKHKTSAYYYVLTEDKVHTHPYQYVSKEDKPNVWDDDDEEVWDSDDQD
jgi:hypothetical protein